MRHVADARPASQPRARRRRCPQPRRITSCQFSRQPCTPSRTPSRGESPSPHRPSPPGGGPPARPPRPGHPPPPRAPDNRAGRRASGAPPGEGCMYTTTLPGTWRTRICRRPDAARRITHHKWPRTSTVRSAESPGSARTRVAQVENRSHSVSSVRSPSSLSMLLCLVKGFVWHFPGLIPGVLKDGERSILLGCGQDRHPRSLDVKRRACFRAAARRLPRRRGCGSSGIRAGCRRAGWRPCAGRGCARCRGRVRRRRGRGRRARC